MTRPAAISSLLQAVAIMATGKFLFAVQDVIIKEMSGGYPVHQIMAIRGSVAIPLLLLLIHFRGGLGSLRQHRATLHLLRGCLMLIAFMCFYVALAGTSLTVATALFFTAPFFITLLSIPLLGEQVGLRRFVSIAIGFAGVLVVLRPSTANFSYYDLLPIVSAFFYSCCQLMVRVAKMTEPPAVMSLYASIAFVVLGSLCGLGLSTIEAAPDAGVSTQFLLRAWALPNSADLLLLTLTGLTSALGFMCSSNAYQREQASRIAPFEYVMIVWVTLLAYLVWSELPDAMTLLGVAMIVGSGIYVIRREADIEAKPIAYSGLTRR
ncbi:MAG TPA: DMT family transporter [Gammaproteobacteria bacterium]|nr:DMT family transporter [Gammaproteobacteria bacterium]